jgi:hypothetical protein
MSRHHRSHLAINPKLFLGFFPKSLSLQNKMVLTDEDDMTAALCIIIILGAYCVNRSLCLSEKVLANTPVMLDCISKYTR